jgi:hypothetical protein
MGMEVNWGKKTKCVELLEYLNSVQTHESILAFCDVCAT